MFSGIVMAVGSIAAAKPVATGMRLEVDAAGLDLSRTGAGDSIAVDGVCLTVVEFGSGRFAVDVSRETLDCTKGFAQGQRVNLELALRVGDQLGGHFVTGHVDGVGRVEACARDGECLRVRLRAPDDVARYVARKGSVAIDGVSLTVNAVDGSCFDVNLIPHTLTVTTFGDLAPARPVNLEIDLVARYLERLGEWSPAARPVGAAR